MHQILIVCNTEAAVCDVVALKLTIIHWLWHNRLIENELWNKDISQMVMQPSDRCDGHTASGSTALCASWSTALREQMNRHVSMWALSLTQSLSISILWRISMFVQRLKRSYVEWRGKLEETKMIGSEGTCFVHLLATLDDYLRRHIAIAKLCCESK